MIGCALAVNAGAQNHPNVCTEEYVELMEIIGRLAGNTIFTMNYAPAYQADIAEHFAGAQQHPAVQWMKAQIGKYGIGYDAVPWLGAHAVLVGGAAEADGIAEGRFELIPNCDKKYKRWPAKAVKEFLPLMYDFYMATDFHKFYLEHADMYAAAVETFRTNVGDFIDTDWFASYFGNDGLDFTIIIGMNNGPGSFGISRQKPGQKKEMISVMLYAEGKDGKPVYKRSSQEDLILVHEFCHSYIAPQKSCKKVATRLMKESWEKVGETYGKWNLTAEETLVRAAVIRYMIDHGYSDEDVREEIKSQHEFYGFTWLPDDIEWYKGDIFAIFEELE